MSLSNKPWAMNRKEFLAALEKVRILAVIFGKFGSPDPAKTTFLASELEVLGEWMNIREEESPGVLYPKPFTPHDIEGFKKLFSKLPQEGSHDQDH